MYVNHVYPWPTYDFWSSFLSYLSYDTTWSLKMSFPMCNFVGVVSLTLSDKGALFQTLMLMLAKSLKLPPWFYQVSMCSTICGTNIVAVLVINRRAIWIFDRWTIDYWAYKAPSTFVQIQPSYLIAITINFIFHHSESYHPTIPAILLFHHFDCKYHQCPTFKLIVDLSVYRFYSVIQTLKDERKQWNS